MSIIQEGKKPMRVTPFLIAMAFGGPVMAGTLGDSIMEPTVVAPTIVAPSPVSTGGFYGSVALAFARPDGSFTQDVQDLEYQSGTLDFDNAFGVSGALGYDYGNGLRVEGEILGSKGDTGRLFFPAATAPFNEAVTDGSLTLTSVMLNGWYTLGSGSVRPFVGGGIGITHGKVDTAFTLGSNNGISDSDTVFAWQIGLGVEIPVSDTMSIVGSLRHFEANGLNLTDNEGTGIEADVDGQIVTIGAMFKF